MASEPGAEGGGLASLYGQAVSSQTGPYAAYLAGLAAADVLLVKGQAGPFELAGGPAFGGPDGQALAAALGTLGWGEDNWCGVLIDPPSRPRLRASQLRWVIEVQDPMLVIALDAQAREALAEAMAATDPSREPAAATDPPPQAMGNAPYPQKSKPTPLGVGVPTEMLGRRLLAVSDFEQALGDDNAKQRVWAELKQAARLPF
jgi:hypothetical protein